MEPANRRLPRGTLVTLIATIALVRLVTFMAVPIGTEADMLRRTGDEKYYFQIAHAIVDRGEFVEGHLRAYRPPLYPTLLAAHLALFGERTWVLAIVQNLFLLAATAVLAVLVARRFGPRIAAVSAALIALNPMWIMLPQQAYAESVFLLLIAGALALTVRLSERASTAAALGAGALFGCAALAREIGLLFGVAVLGCLWLTARERLGARVVTRVCATALLAMTLVVGAWSARNYSVFHRVVPISTNGPINLYIGNSPPATGYFHFQIPPRAREVWNSPSTHGASEIQSMSVAGEEAVRYIKEHPARTAQLTGKKVAALWLPVPRTPFALTPGAIARYGRMAYYFAFTALAFGSVWKLRGSFFGRAVMAMVVVTSVVHAATHVDLRFRAPADFVLAVPAAMSVLALVERIRTWLQSGGRSFHLPGRTPAGALGR